MRMPKSLALTELECKETRCQDFNKIYSNLKENQKKVLFEEITLLKYFYLAVITKHNMKFTQVPKSHPLSLSAHECYKILLNHIHGDVTHDCIERESRVLSVYLQ